MNIQGQLTEDTKKKLKNTWRKYTEELYNMKNRCKEQIYVAEE